MSSKPYPCTRAEAEFERKMDHENEGGGQTMNGKIMAHDQSTSSRKVRRSTERKNMMAMLTLAPANTNHACPKWCNQA